MTKTILYPIFSEISGDLDTPVSVYLKLQEVNSFLLESVIGGEQIVRYSYIGFDPFCIFETTGNEIKITLNNKTQIIKNNPIEELEKIVNQFSLKKTPDLPEFIGGAVGFFSWEVIKHIEKIISPKKNKSQFPLAHFLFPKALIIFDHVKRKMILLILAEKKELGTAKKRLGEIKKILQKPSKAESIDLAKNNKKDIFTKVKCNYKKADFIIHIKKVKKYILEGDIFQLVLSQKFSLKSKKKPFDVYRKLRYINPSPYMFYFNFPNYQVIGSSPEILSMLTDKKAVVRPIAGTRLRIFGQEEALIKELQADAKEKAEHIMLVDLGRNDLGRVCEYDSVKTTALMEIEKYSHVMHLVSNVEGTIKKGKNAFDLLKATFPAGTVSGAPKIRAMEIIEELEPDERGPYAGALGYFDFRGNMDLCIIIRTILAKNKEFFIQAGAGLVADSIPEKEYQETQNKARGMLEACL